MYHLYLSLNAVRDAVCIIFTCHLMLWGMQYVSSLPVTWCCEGCSMHHLYLSHDAVRDAVCIISYLSHNAVRECGMYHLYLSQWHDALMEAVCIISTCHLMLWGMQYVSSLPVEWCCEWYIMFHLYLSLNAVRDAVCIISNCRMMLWGIHYVSSLPVT